MDLWCCNRVLHCYVMPVSLSHITARVIGQGMPVVNTENQLGNDGQRWHYVWSATTTSIHLGGRSGEDSILCGERPLWHEFGNIASAVLCSEWYLKAQNFKTKLDKDCQALSWIMTGLEEYMSLRIGYTKAMLERVPARYIPVQKSCTRTSSGILMTWHIPSYDVIYRHMTVKCSHIPCPFISGHMTVICRYILFRKVYDGIWPSYAGIYFLRKVYALIWGSCASGV
jgi:hypothetical protein